MKCYVTKNREGDCIITRIDCKNQNSHRRIIKTSDFLDFWFNKVRVEKLTRWFQFMSRDSFCAEWIDFDERAAIMLNRECIFILDDSLCTDDVIDYLKKEIEKYFIENKEKLDRRCDSFSKCFNYGTTNEKGLIDAIRHFDQTGSLDRLNGLGEPNTVIAAIKMFMGKWKFSKRLFSKQSHAYSILKVCKKTYLILLSIASCDLVWSLSILNLMSCLGILIMSTAIWLPLKRSFLKTANSMVEEELREAYGLVLFDKVNYEDAFDSLKKNEEKTTFLDLIKRDVEIIRTCEDVDLSSEIKNLSLLAENYARSGFPIESDVIRDYLTRLLAIEEGLFGKMSISHVEINGETTLGIDDLDKRLEMLGLDKVIFQKLPVYRLISDTLSILNDMPFAKREFEIARLFRVAINGIDTPTSRSGIPYDELEKMIQEDISRIYAFKNSNQKYEELTKSLNELEKLTDRSTPRETHTLPKNNRLLPVGSTKRTDNIS